ncbi:hypothetical protein KKF38_03390 [Patescibacteria group bacterium]|nr:hypothetical protein [Patescibacteria group bacterium]
MEFDFKNLRKFFLEALEQTVMPRFDSIDEEMDSLRSEMGLLRGEMDSLRGEMESGFAKVDVRLNQIESKMDRTEKELLDLREQIIPEFREIQEQFKIVVKELDFLKKSGGNKEVFNKIDLLERFTAKLKRELMLLAKRVEKFENNLKQLRQSQKRRAAK